ncbi:hypothetical protein FGO68_gene4030 [Halteria grandinella]|uniref:HTH luxR-type domain-containing protein n=1 Tax=Halteria grandinella TaxID=5974 RepID=A0A8J8N8H0_HALGN|nr:hypothetical protein FGO68_gene4030 [Halteria grandinella]
MVKAAAAQPTVFRESVVHEMTERIKAKNSDTGALEEKLTAREFEILKHLTTGVPLSAIARQLHISQNTMKTHLRNVYRKLGVDGRYSAVEKAKKLLLIQTILLRLRAWARHLIVCGPVAQFPIQLTEF